MAVKLIVATSLVLNAVLWSHSRYYAPSVSQWSNLPPLPAHKLVARHWQEWGVVSNSTLWESEPTCAPLSVPVDQQCRHVKKFCPKEDTFLAIDYLENYFCATPTQRPFQFVGLILWLMFLFSFIGITASDFFCPNLATIAHVFGLSENIAGVTFLAFGNGSPDLFSTYSAMRTNSGSLAIGELLGAASFIVSVVVGSMCIIKPFHVRRTQFIRDVGFFTAAVAMLLAILVDGRIMPWEALLLVGLYVVYVLTVIFGTWFETRRREKRRREELIRAEYANDAIDSETPTAYTDYTGEEPYHDDRTYSPREQDHYVLTQLYASAPPVAAVHLTPASPRVRAHSNPTHPTHGAENRTRPIIDTRRISQSQVLTRPSRDPSPTSGAPRLLRRYSVTPTRPHSPSLPSFSLLGALEFRSVINSLQKEANAETLSIFETPVTPYAAGHYHRHSLRHSRSIRGSIPFRGSEYDDEQDPWDAALRAEHPEEGASGDRLARLGGTSHPHRKSPIPSISVISPDSPTPPIVDSQHMLPIPTSVSAPADLYALRSASASPVRHRERNGSLSLASKFPPGVPGSKRARARYIIRRTFHTLFPTLHNLASPNKSWMGRIAGIVAAPAILGLTLTLPVVILSEEDEAEENVDPSLFVPEGQLVDVDVEGGVENGHVESRPLSPLSRGEGSRRGRRESGGVGEDEDEEARRAEERLDSDMESDIMSIQEDIEEDIHGGPGLQFNKWLMAAQCIVGPVFASAVLFSTSDNGLWIILGALGAGVVLATLVLIFAKDGKKVAGRIARCLMGFAVAVTWIMAIADEVVRVLQTFGYIFGLSDAIVGLTIFAIGNSLADFVANLSVATFAPIMGFSACFGGPMLNILLGVGISGSLVLRAEALPWYPIEFGATLLVSSMGLLFLLVSTLIVVPMNGFLLSKRWGIFLIMCYAAIMTVNVVVEVKMDR